MKTPYLWDVVDFILFFLPLVSNDTPGPHLH